MHSDYMTHDIGGRRCRDEGDIHFRACYTLIDLKLFAVDEGSVLA